MPKTPAMSKKKNAGADTVGPNPKLEPKGWRGIYDLIIELRSQRDAPVDTMGAEALPEKNVPKEVFEYQVLISLALSSKTKDEKTAEAVRNLQAKGLTVQNVAKMPLATLSKLISCVGFFNQKAKHMSAAAKMIVDKFGGKVPDSAEGLMELPGVGPKMAHLVMNIAFGVCQGIGVDQHVHRICNDLHWAKGKDAEETRKCLETWVPYEDWARINLLLVGLGQQMQTKKAEMLLRCLETSHPCAALQLMASLGLALNTKFDTPEECHSAYPGEKKITIMDVAVHRGLNEVEEKFEKYFGYSLSEMRGDILGYRP